jgi:hypothetical protein
LRHCTFQLRNEIPARHQLAQLLGAHCQGKHSRNAR